MTAQAAALIRFIAMACVALPALALVVLSPKGRRK